MVHWPRKSCMKLVLGHVFRDAVPDVTFDIVVSSPPNTSAASGHVVSDAELLIYKRIRGSQQQLHGHTFLCG